MTHVSPDRSGSIRDVLLAVVIAAASLSGLWWLLVRAEQNDDTWLRVIDAPVTLEPRLMLGRPEAPVVIVVASDFQCPYCAMFATQTMPRIRTELVETGQVSFYFRHFIGPTHRLAAPAATLAECAGTVGAFWEVHDQLFAARRLLNEAFLTHLKDSLVSADGRRVSCSEEPTVLKEDTRWALQLGATGSPSFFFGRRIGDKDVLLKYGFGGARAFTDFRRIVERLRD